MGLKEKGQEMKGKKDGALIPSLLTPGTHG